MIASFLSFCVKMPMHRRQLQPMQRSVELVLLDQEELQGKLFRLSLTRRCLGKKIMDCHSVSF